jgi:uncharacterized protein (DUF433 family)
MLREEEVRMPHTKRKTELPPQLVEYEGALRIAGTRVPFDIVVDAYDRGETPEEICLQYPTVPIGSAYAAISYYLNNRADVEKYLKGRRAKAEVLRRKHEAKWPSQGLRQKLVERMKSSGQHRA